jgi:hypothetical protein
MLASFQRNTLAITALAYFSNAFHREVSAPKSEIKETARIFMLSVATGTTTLTLAITRTI